jgi:4-amino-4-deoxy-L-arabinose transferase-like glycosyltransferase
MVRGFLAEKTSWKQFICPVILFVSLLATILLEVLTVIGYASVKTWLLPIIAVSGGFGILLFILHFFKAKKAALIASTACLLVSVLAAPIYWSLTPVLYVPNSTMPYAGPELASLGNGAGNGVPNNPNSTSSNSKTSSGTEKTQTSGLEAYLIKNYKSGSFLLTTQRADTVAQYIIDTGLPCYAYGGFLGSDKSLTLDKLKTLVAEGKITYFLASSEGGGDNSNSEILTYVKANATLVDSSAYNGSSSNSAGDKGMGSANGSLYLFKTK